MPDTDLEAEKLWAEKATLEMERESDVSLDLEWGPLWNDPKSRRRPRTANALQLILSRGPLRKIIWLDTDDLRSATCEGPNQPNARERIRSRVSKAIIALERSLRG
jgi:hypothetical protein